MTLAKAVFLDRDGVLVRAFPDGDTTRGPRAMDELDLLPGTIENLSRLHAKRFIPLCITNQPDIKRQLTTHQEQRNIGRWLRMNTPIYDDCICPHDDSDYCACRKPQPGMIYWFAVLLHIDLSRSWLIGDRVSDILAAVRAGIPLEHTFKIETNQGTEEAVEWILKNCE